MAVGGGIRHGGDGFHHVQSEVTDLERVEAGLARGARHHHVRVPDRLHLQ